MSVFADGGETRYVEKDGRGLVFVIATSNVFCRVFEFDFGSRYRDFLDADAEGRADLELECPADIEVRVSRSKWHDLTQPLGRQKILCNFVSILVWHHRHSSA